METKIWLSKDWEMSEMRVIYLVFASEQKDDKEMFIDS